MSALSQGCSPPECRGELIAELSGKIEAFAGWIGRAGRDRLADRLRSLIPPQYHSDTMPLWL